MVVSQRMVHLCVSACKIVHVCVLEPSSGGTSGSGHGHVTWTYLKRTSCLCPSIKSEYYSCVDMDEYTHLPLSENFLSNICVLSAGIRVQFSCWCCPVWYCRAHWYLVVVCFPGLDEPHYVERGDHASVHVETENADDTTAQSESQHGDGDTNSGTFHPSDSIEHCQYFFSFLFIVAHFKDKRCFSHHRWKFFQVCFCSGSTSKSPENLKLKRV